MPMWPERLKILLIEDNDADALLLQEILRRTPGFTHDLQWVQLVASGLAKLAAQPFDLIFLDLSLPDSQGFETVTQMRAAAAQVPLIVLTGLEDEQLVS